VKLTIYFKLATSLGLSGGRPLFPRRATLPFLSTDLGANAL